MAFYSEANQSKSKRSFQSFEHGIHRPPVCFTFFGHMFFPISLSLPTYHASGTCHILAMCSVMYSTYRRGLRDQKIVDDYYSMDFLSHHITQHDFCYLHICTPLSDPTWQSKGRFQMVSTYLVHDAALCWTWVIYQTVPTHGKV